jgi:pfkB family carbohydrate kinase/Nucleoside 2-deoxyribosyltransferase
VIIVGGTYFEHCETPPERTLRGSGLRAAAALRNVDPDVRLVTAIDAQTKEEAEFVLGGFDLEAAVVTRTEPVSFRYFTPISPPVIGGRLSAFDELKATGETALVFGMIEGEPTVSAETLVYDPQQPLDLAALDLERFTYERLAIVTNAGEARALGHDEDVPTAARNLFEHADAEVVVTKRAARGALVTTADGQHEVGPYPTHSVWPIGSGDVFAAGFAWAWARGDAPAEAARVGSLVASFWCETRSLDIPQGLFEGSSAATYLEPLPARIYLGGPFFNLGQRWLVELVREALRSLGGEVFSPLHDVGSGAEEVAKADLDGLDSCGSMLALLDEDDPGTLFEAGWATSHGIPIVGYAERLNPEACKMLLGTGAELHDDLSSAVYRSIWAAMGMRLST